MKKTFTLSIGGALFNVEDDAFIKLESYINGIRAYFEENPDKDEILNDIEGRIAEKFSEKNSPIITLLDVNAVIETMGTVEQFKTEGDTEKRDTASTKTAKQLYRDRDSAIIAGVSAGLGHYFGLNPLIIRLIFLVSLFLGGTGAIIYVILWLLVPEAKTPSQKLSMRGDKVTISAMADMIKDRLDEVKSPKKESIFRQVISVPIEALHILVQFIQKAIFPSIRVLLGTVMLVGSFILAVAATIGASFALFAMSETFIQGPLLSIAQSSLAQALILSLYLAVLIPIIFIVSLGVRFLSKRPLISRVAAMSLIGFWFVAIAVAGATGSKLAVQATDMVQNNPYYKPETQMVDVGSFTKVSIMNHSLVHFVQGDAYKVEVKGRSQDLSRMTFVNATGTLSVGMKSEERGPCIVCREGRVEVTITAPSIMALALTDSSYASGEVKGDVLSITLDNNSSLDVEIDSKNSVFEIKDSSFARMRGKTDVFTANIQNSSRMQGSEFEIKNASMQISSGSYANVYVTGKLDVTLANSSRLAYIGEPAITKKIDMSSRLEGLNESER